MAWRRARGPENGTLAPSVERLLSAARSAEARPQYRWDSSGHAENYAGKNYSGQDSWRTARPGWSVRQPVRTTWGDRTGHWSDWSRDSRAGRDSWRQTGWHWGEWGRKDIDAEDRGTSAAGGHSTAVRALDESWQSPWSWDDYIVMKGTTVRVELSGAELGDSDLASLARHLDVVLRRYVERTHGKYNLNIDLSCNLYISDDGITEHLAPFLHRWPVCHRLKLFKTSIGDGALDALRSWAASGYAHELHLSDLGGQVTGDAVFGFLKEVHEAGNYPYWNSDGYRCSLWLRLEHNALQNTDKLVGKAHSHGMSLSVLQKPDLGQVRPGTASGQHSRDVPAVNLVLFHKQDLRVSRSWISSMVPMAPVSPELQQLVSASYSAALDLSAEGRSHGPEFMARFLGPSQRYLHAHNGQGGEADEEEADDTEAKLSRALVTIRESPACENEEVLRRWRYNIERASDPEREAHQILRATAKRHEPGYTGRSNFNQLEEELPPHAASQGNAAELTGLDNSPRVTRKPEGEESNEDVVISLGVGPPVPPPPALALVAAACA